MYATIPNDGVLPYVGDDNSTASKVADSDRFWWRYFGHLDEAQWINDQFAANAVGFWEIGRRGAALVQMYDLLAPVDFPRAMVYLERLRVLSEALLNNRDDRRTAPVPPGVHLVNGKPFDPFHGQVMPAWGGIGANLDNHWIAQVGLAGLFTYPMAAFAKRVAAHPGWFCSQYKNDAIRFTIAVVETYVAFRPEMHLVDGDPNGFYIHPTTYSALTCGDPATQESCLKQKRAAGYGSPWNLSLSNLKAMAEVASAADSTLYRSSSDSLVTVFVIHYATQEAPRLIAKNINYLLSSLKPETLGDGTKWIWWNRHPPDYTSVFPTWPDDLPHGQFTLGSIVSIWENKGLIDGLLARNGYPERVGLDTTILTRMANTFLRKIWRYNYTQGSTLRNLLAFDVKGGGSPSLTNNMNQECAGYIGLAQFDPWVWVRCRDSIYNAYLSPNPGVWPKLREDNHAALLRYR
jgi:hypothetical protein